MTAGPGLQRRDAGLGLRRRHAFGALGQVLTAFCAALAAGTLIVILLYVVAEGGRALNLSFLTQLPRPVGVAGGGVANGIVGSLIIVLIATAMALPVGVLIGIYLAIYGRGVFPEAIRFLSEVLSGVPSIAIGLFAYTLLVQPLGHFSAFSASFAFMLLMLPLIIRTSEDAIRSVPPAVREGALALGLPAYASVVHVVLPAARPLIITGSLLAVARIAGETAPLLFTAFGSQFWELSPFSPMAVLPLQIFTYAISPYNDWHRQAWAGALVLISVVIVLNVGARWSLRSRNLT
jgi:phosphate transport system permease protein